jgi:hypothetical protein
MRCELGRARKPDGPIGPLGSLFYNATVRLWRDDSSYVVAKGFIYPPPAVALFAVFTPFRSCPGVGPPDHPQLVPHRLTSGAPSRVCRMHARLSGGTGAEPTTQSYVTRASLLAPMGLPPVAKGGAPVLR